MTDDAPISAAPQPALDLAADSADNSPAGTDLLKPTRPWLGPWLAALGVCALIASVALVASGQAGHGYFVIVSAYALVAVAALFDVALRLVPNRLTYPALLLALAINVGAVPLLRLAGADSALVWLGTPGAIQALEGLGLCVAIGLVSFAARGLGGGDVKLLAALGALVGLDAIVPILVNTLAVAAVVGLINLAIRGLLVRRLQAAFLRVMETILTRRLTRPVSFPRTESPFCLSLLSGMVLLPWIDLHHMIWTALRGG